ncbi:four helix bundle protein [Reichenbachiella faecimaris]|uniref:Four helix bundle protein n=1 Tax=Reichenbachiella faecimaris TaxID=692418 RepID=A0A1W2G623_REIFA|nr:four helix bundle protein [Reichenbachiella faecimaris]SMD32129.1 four helix bundle protein [Reichenbachiella faecimaris]
MLQLEELEVWRKGREFRNEISALCKIFPNEEKYKLIDQMIRASRFITANVAEGYGRFHYQENIQYCRQARGSITEMYDHLTVALDEAYINEEQFSRYDLDIKHLLKLINGYIAHLKKKKG